jgi:hypothetical protein
MGTRTWKLEKMKRRENGWGLELDILGPNRTRSFKKNQTYFKPYKFSNF